MTAEVLFQIDEIATESYHRTHVTPFIYEHPEQFQLLSVQGEEDWSRLRWTVDQQEDLDFIRAISSRLPNSETDWRVAAKLVTSHPELSKINTHVRQKETREG